MVTGLATTVLVGDDLNAEANKRAHVGGDEAIGANDIDHAPAGRQGHADLDDARIACSGGGVDLLA